MVMAFVIPPHPVVEHNRDTRQAVCLWCALARRTRMASSHLQEQTRQLRAHSQTLGQRHQTLVQSLLVYGVNDHADILTEHLAAYPI